MDFSPIITNYQEQNQIVVSDINELNQLSIQHRKNKMLVLVINDGNSLVKEFKMELGHYSDDLLDNENWVATNIFSIPIYFNSQVKTELILPTTFGVIEIYENILNTGLYSLLSYNGGDYYIGVQNGIFLLSFPRIMSGCIKFKEI